MNKCTNFFFNEDYDDKSINSVKILLEINKYLDSVYLEILRCWRHLSRTISLYSNRIERVRGIVSGVTPSPQIAGLTDKIKAKTK